MNEQTHNTLVNRLGITSVVILCALLTSSLPIIVHFASVKHTVCVEHGELLHGTDGADSIAPIRVVGLTVDSNSTGTGHSHDVCFICSNSDRSIEGDGDDDGNRPPASEDRLTTPYLNIAAPSSPLAVAPKTSPPA